jgi:hypothetical protein
LLTVGLAGPLSLVVVSVAGLTPSAAVALYLATGFQVGFAALWFSVFPCPACKHEWFGSRGEQARGRLFGTLVLMATQKLCCNCGLPKFMDPSGWDETTASLPDER